MSEEEKEIKELKSRLSLIEEFYQENSFIKRIKFYLKYYKEKFKNDKNNRNNDTTRNNTIYNNSIDNISINANDKIFNSKEII